MELIQKIYKSSLLMAGLLCIIQAGQAQTASPNYIRTRVPRTPITTVAQLDAATTDKTQVMTTMDYIDGLGRPLQTVQRQGSPLGNDIIQPFTYDAYSREAQKYLPYVSTSTNYGSYRTDAFGATTGVKAFYNPANGTAEGKQANGIVLTQYPYTPVGFENSPLNTVVEQGAPGAAWQIPGAPDAASNNHTARSVQTLNDQTSFSTATTGNIGSHMVALYQAPINANGSRSLTRTGNTATYDNGQLLVVISRNENWKNTDGCFGTTEEYKDKEGHVLLKRTYNIKAGTTPTAEMLSTYYVYDDMGNLAFVLPPGANPDATAAISQTTIDTKCYQYRYDAPGRLYQKKIPGKGWEFVIYNGLDQPVATQDSVQRMKAIQEWTVTKYDPLGRAVITGVYQYGTTAGADNHVAVQTAADAVTTLWETPVSTGTGYTAAAWPTAWTTTLSVSYYDIYNNIPGLPSLYNQQANVLYSPQTTGLATASKTLVLNTTADYLWSVPYYDKEGKPIRTFSEHYLGGSTWLSPYNYDDVQTVYNFVKQPLTVTRLHYNKNSGGTAAVLMLTSADSYTYDHMGRRLKSSNQLTDGTNTAQQQVVVSQSVYNEIGQLKQKGLHSINGTSFLQNVNYRYNARGWLTNINNGSLTNDPLTSTDLNDQFGMDLKYDDAAAPQYNGNIGSVKTLTGALSGATLPALTYNYTYDKLNRLTDAISTTSAANDGFYSENLTYDPMGNIQTLKRYDKNGAAAQLIDNLNYIYVTGNKIDRIDDAGTAAGFNNAVSQAGEYTYDGNGSQLTDLNRGLTQAYNMLNLPQTVTKSGISIAYIYDATGRKLRKLSTNSGITTVTEYIAGIQYQYSTATPVLDFISTEEGRARKSGSVYKYEYDLKDHLGNTRITTTWNASDATQMTPLNSQRSDYYAFGYAIQSLQGTTPSPKNQYLYNHKELQEETGLYDYGARFYDPVIGRWGVVDPLAEKGRRWSPYIYGFDEPTLFIDPDGMWSIVSHYRMTKRALIAAGVDRKTAKEIAHYASTAADHPTKLILLANQIMGVFGGTNPKELSYKKGVDYSDNKNSQNYEKENQTIHATRGTLGEESNVTAAQAVERTVKSATAIFEKFAGQDLSTLSVADKKAVGLAFHGIEDADAHNGATWTKEPGKQTHSSMNDLFGDKTKAKDDAKAAALKYFKTEE